MKKTFSTGEVASLCGISQQTVIRQFDRGLIEGFKVPGSRFRKIPRESLIMFMKINGIPSDGLNSLTEDEQKQIQMMDRLIEHLKQERNDVLIKCYEFLNMSIPSWAKGMSWSDIKIAFRGL